MGFILSLCAIVGGCLVAVYGNAAAGTTIATAAVASLAGVFVYGTAQRRKELSRKAEAVPAEPPSQH